MSVLSPIKNPDDMELILAHFKSRSIKIYILANLMLHTGASLVDLLETKYVDAYAAVSFTNRKSGVFFCFDDEFARCYNSYVDSLPSNSQYLFPNKKVPERPMTAPATSRQIISLSSEIGIPVRPQHIQKTFALNYFKEHGNLDGTHLCCQGYDKESVCAYLCLTDDEYYAYKSGILPPADMIGDVGTLAYVQALREAINGFFDEYENYMDERISDRTYEASAALIMRRLHAAMSGAPRLK